jgi:DNA-binding NarL/FixJ family response regulator
LAPTILIVDDSALMRRVLRSTIEKDSEWEVCGEAENGKIAVEKVKELHPVVVFLDLQMPVMNGLEAARQINAIAPKTEMLMYTMHNSEQVQKDAHSAGIKQVVSKTDGARSQATYISKTGGQVHSLSGHEVVRQG